MTRTPQFSWPLRVLPGLGEELVQVLAERGYQVTAEDVCAELARPEWERGPKGQHVTLALRHNWQLGDLFFGPCSLLVYSYGRLGLREEMRAMPLRMVRR